MRSTPARIASAAALAALVILLFVQPWKSGSADAINPQTSRAGLGATDRNWLPEEIFRRAFWRHPAAADKILRAERFEWLADDESLTRWQWFIELNPSPELLGWLSDPETFGLIRSEPGSAIRTWADKSSPPPEWFPLPETASEFEVRQTPTGHFSLLYRKSDNTLFAADSGEGFAAAVPR